MATSTTRKASTTKKADDPFADDNDSESGPDTSVEAGPNYVRATLKGGGGYDAPWLVITSQDLSSLSELLGNKDDMKATLDQLWAASEYFAAQAPEGSVSKSAPKGKGGGGQPPRQAPPGGETRECDHGQMVYKTGTSAKGPWRAFMCPAGREDPSRCQPQFLR